MKLFIFTTAFLFSYVFGFAQQYFNQDCVGAESLCLSRYELPYTFVGAGQVQELWGYYHAASNFCLINGENNSAWYKLQFDAPGELVFSIAAYGPLDDYDFALFDLTGLTCADIANSTAPYLRCSYTASNGRDTGLAFDSTGTSASANGADFLAPLTVDSGDVIYLVVDNFTRNGAGFSIDFAGTTAGMVSNDSFYITSGYTTVLPDTIKVDMFFSQTFYCGTLSNDFSEFTLIDDTGDTLEIVSVECDSAQRKVTVNTLHPAHAVASVVVHYQDGFDGNIIIAQCGGAELNGTPKTFEARNGPGKLDFTHVNAGFNFLFTPEAHYTANLQWYVNNAAWLASTSQSLLSLDADLFTLYTVCLVADYGSVKDSVCKDFYLTGLNDIAPAAAFQLYPNPASSEVSIQLPYGGQNVTVFDINGKTVATFANIKRGETLTLNTLEMPQGLYMVRVTHAYGSATQKLQVMH